MSLMKRFVHQVGIRKKQETINLLQPGFNRGFDPYQFVYNFQLGIWTGASRIIHCDWLRNDLVFQSIIGKCTMRHLRIFTAGFL